MLPTWQIIYVFSCLFVAGLTESTFGFGSALIAMPLLVLVLDLRTASPIMALVAVVLSVVVLAKSWRQIQFGGIWRLALGALPGIPLGIWLLMSPHQDVMKLVLALIILAFPVYRLMGPALPAPKKEWPAYLFGFLAGVLGGAYNTSGPPVVIYASLKRWEPGPFRASLLAFFLAISVFVNLGQYCSGNWTPAVLRLFALSLPVLLVAVLIGNWLHPRIPAGKFDRAVHVILFGIGLSLLVGTLRTMLR